MNLQEAFQFCEQNNMPYCFSLFQPYSADFYQFMAEAREKDLKHDDDLEFLGTTDLGTFDFIEEDGNIKYVPLDLPVMCEAKAEYQGQKVELNKPKRGGDKKFYVYVRDSKSGNIRKVSFGAADGGGSLKVKFNDPKKRASFAARHNCKGATDKTTASYWSCRLPRYAAMLGMEVSNPGGYW